MKRIAAVLAVVLGLIAGSAQASLIGDTVTCSITGSGIFTCSQPTAIVGAGAEFTFGNTEQYFSVNFGASNVLFTVLLDNSLGGTIFNSSDLTTAFTSASLTSISGINNFGASNITLTGGLLSVDLRGTNSMAGATIDIALGTSSVPEPGTVVLLSLCLGVMGLMARRKQT